MEMKVCVKWKFCNCLKGNLLEVNNVFVLVIVKIYTILNNIKLYLHDDMNNALESMVQFWPFFEVSIFPLDSWFCESIAGKNRSDPTWNA